MKKLGCKKANWVTENLPMLILILVFLALILMAIAIRGKNILRPI